MNVWCFHNGSFVRKEDIHISIDDLGFSRGYTLFEHCRTHHGKIFHLEEHFLRLQHSAKALLLDLPYSLDDIELILQELFQRNQFKESGFKFYLTLGLPKEWLTPIGKPTFIIYPYELTSYQPLDFSYELNLQTTTHPRAFPEHKTTFYLPGMLAKRSCSQPVDEILFLDSNNHLLESTTASFIGFKEDVMLIPEGLLLKSITQEVLFFLGKQLFKIEKRPISYQELPELTEACLSSSVKPFLSIKTIDGLTIGNPAKRGALIALQEAYCNYLKQGAWHFLEGFESYRPCISCL